MRLYTYDSRDLSSRAVICRVGRRGVMSIGADSPIQQDLFDINAEQFQKMKRLDEVIDRINRMHGSETIVLGSQQYTRPNGEGKADVFANAIKHDFKSPNPTTRWSDVIRLNANAKKKE